MDKMRNFSFEQNNKSNYRSMEDAIVGSVYVTSSLLYIAVYVPTIIVIIRDEDLMRRSCYKIMVAMGILDIIQLLFTGVVAGAYTIADSTYSFTTNKITVICISCCGLYGIVYLVAYMTRDLEVIYFLDDYTWNYNQVKVPSYICWAVELFNDILNTIFMIACYCGIAIYIRKKRTVSSKMEMSTKEKRALLQSFLMCSLIAIYVAIWFGIDLISESQWALMSMNVIWIIMAGTNGIFYPVFNRTVRRHLMVLLHIPMAIDSRKSQATKNSPDNVTNVFGIFRGPLPKIDANHTPSTRNTRILKAQSRIVLAKPEDLGDSTTANQRGPISAWQPSESSE